MAIEIQKPWATLCLSLLLALAIMLSLTGTIFADQVVGSATITGGNLTMSAADAPTVSATLNGTNQTVTDQFTIDLNDARGSGAGWNLQITSTTFTDGSHSLSTSAASITAVSSLCDQGTCTAPTNSVGYPLTIPADTVAPTAVAFFNAALNTGMGDFTVTPTFSLSVPANTYAGTYNSTITITAASGP